MLGADRSDTGDDMAGWNYAEIWEVIATQIPDAPAQVQGERRFTWRQFDERANGVARRLLDAGAVEQDKVAQYLYNCPEYLESMYAAWKAGLVPINTNYRYAEDELVYLWDNADVVAVVFHGAFTETIDRILDRVPGVQLWLWVDDGSGPCPDWAEPYEAAATSHPDRVEAPWGRDGDHLYMLYTGGTTGMPKGVMWRQDDHIRNIIALGTNPRYGEDPVDYGVTAELVNGPGIVSVPACPLMHGTGCMTQLIALSGGGCVVTLEHRHLDIEELFDTIERHGANTTAIVGDAFAKPMLRALDANPGRWDLSSLFVFTSSGVMFSEGSKQRLIEHLPHAMIVDAFSSSEAVGMGQSVSSASGGQHTAKFSLGPNTKVFTEDLREVEPGSGEIGKVAVGGHQPIGYYKDPEKTAATFLTVDGKRYSVPGDFATVEADGSITLLGRGSVCINTGGEKVFPEEVEEVLKTHESVRDAVAVGVPDERFGEAITAVVELAPDAVADDAAIIDHVKAHLAHYKAPKHVVAIDTIGRAPNGKVDYKRLKAYAATSLGIDG
jgi:fatty-acyl-CoA synthase